MIVGSAACGKTYINEALRLSYNNMKDDKKIF